VLFQGRDEEIGIFQPNTWGEGENFISLAEALGSITGMKG
jgi:hypothetical protein